MKIFITGWTGFIGTHLVKKLQERGHDLRLLSADLSEKEKWQKEITDFVPDAVIHLAWEGLPDYGVDLSKKNIRYALDLFSFLREINCEIVLSVGSAWEKTSPEDIFPVSKKIISLWGKAILKKFIWARIFFVYGPGQRETSLIPYLIRCAKTGETIQLKNPLARNDFIYVEDVADAISFLVENAKKSGEYDLGSGRVVSNQKVVNLAAEELGKPEWKKELVADSGDCLSSADVSGLASMGWRPKISLAEGIKKMIDYYSS